MRFWVVSFAALALLLGAVNASAAIVPVAPDDFKGSRWTGYGITATGQWGQTSPEPGFMISWDITDNGDGTYTYEYSFSIPEKDLSHWILELSEFDAVGKPLQTYWADLFSDDEVKTYGPSDPSNPGIPGEVYGVKDASTPWLGKSFTTDQAPVWGDFYAVDGKKPGYEVYAYNSGFGQEPTPDFTDWIARPDGGEVPPQIIPEPATIVIWSVVGLFFAGAYRWRRRSGWSQRTTKAIHGIIDRGRTR